MCAGGVNRDRGGGYGKGYAMRYNESIKRGYIGLCRRYNRAAARLATPEGKAEFVALSLRLHAMKADVPKKWGSAAFVRDCGT